MNNQLCPIFVALPSIAVSRYPGLKNGATVGYYKRWCKLPICNLNNYFHLTEVIIYRGYCSYWRNYSYL